MANLKHEMRRNPETGKHAMYFRIAWREEGKQKYRALGYLTEREAETALKQWEARRTLGLATSPGKQPPSSSASTETMKEWWSETGRMALWFASRGGNPRVPMGAGKQIAAIIGSTQLHEVNPVVIDEVISALRARDLSGRTIQIYLEWLRRGLEVAKEDGLIAAVPTFPKVKSTPRPSKWLAPEETRKMLAKLDDADWADPQAVIAIRLAEYLVLRPGEVLNRKWGDVQRDPQWTQGALLIRAVRMPDGKVWVPKAKSERAQPLSLDLLKRLRTEWMRQGQPGPDAWLCPSPADSSKPMGTFRGALKGACKQAGVTQLHPHALRHTGATRLALAGVSRRTLMAIGGWASGQMLDCVYEHTSDAEVAKALGAAPGANVPQLGNTTPDLASGVTRIM